MRVSVCVWVYVYVRASECVCWCMCMRVLLLLLLDYLEYDESKNITFRTTQFFGFCLHFYYVIEFCELYTS